MATNDESCDSNANFAIICSFITKFGNDCGVQITIPGLQQMLEDTKSAVSEELKEIHIHLLRKGKKRVNKEKWEKSLIKFCHEYSSVDAWELERFGYKKAKLSVKLELLKRLLELQFDSNAKFKAEVNKHDAESLRVVPIGRDIDGNMYWYQLDNDCNMRLYKQDATDESVWELLCSTKESLADLIVSLGKQTVKGQEAMLHIVKPSSLLTNKVPIDDVEDEDDIKKENGEGKCDDLTSTLSPTKPCAIIIKTERKEIVCDTSEDIKEQNVQIPENDSPILSPDSNQRTLKTEIETTKAHLSNDTSTVTSESRTLNIVPSESKKSDTSDKKTKVEVLDMDTNAQDTKLCVGDSQNTIKEADVDLSRESASIKANKSFHVLNLEVRNDDLKSASLDSKSDKHLNKSEDFVDSNFKGSKIKLYEKWKMQIQSSTENLSSSDPNVKSNSSGFADVSDNMPMDLSSPTKENVTVKSVISSICTANDSPALSSGAPMDLTKSILSKSPNSLTDKLVSEQSTTPQKHQPNLDSASRTNTNKLSQNSDAFLCRPFKKKHLLMTEAVTDNQEQNRHSVICEVKSSKLLAGASEASLPYSSRPYSAQVNRPRLMPLPSKIDKPVSAKGSVIQSVCYSTLPQNLSFPLSTSEASDKMAPVEPMDCDVICDKQTLKAEREFSGQIPELSSEKAMKIGKSNDALSVRDKQDENFNCSAENLCKPIFKQHDTASSVNKTDENVAMDCSDFTSDVGQGCEKSLNAGVWKDKYPKGGSKETLVNISGESFLDNKVILKGSSGDFKQADTEKPLSSVVLKDVKEEKITDASPSSIAVKEDSPLVEEKVCLKSEDSWQAAENTEFVKTDESIKDRIPVDNHRVSNYIPKKGEEPSSELKSCTDNLNEASNQCEPVKDLDEPKSQDWDHKKPLDKSGCSSKGDESLCIESAKTIPIKSSEVISESSEKPDTIMSFETPCESSSTSSDKAISESSKLPQKLFDSSSTVQLERKDNSESLMSKNQDHVESSTGLTNEKAEALIPKSKKSPDKFVIANNNNVDTKVSSDKLISTDINELPSKNIVETEAGQNETKPLTDIIKEGISNEISIDTVEKVDKCEIEVNDSKSIASQDEKTIIASPEKLKLVDDVAESLPKSKVDVNLVSSSSEIISPTKCETSSVCQKSTDHDSISKQDSQKLQKTSPKDPSEDKQDCDIPCNTSVPHEMKSKAKLIDPATHVLKPVLSESIDTTNSSATVSIEQHSEKPSKEKSEPIENHQTDSLKVVADMSEKSIASINEMNHCKDSEDRNYEISFSKDNCGRNEVTKSNEIVSKDKCDKILSSKNSDCIDNSTAEFEEQNCKIDPAALSKCSDVEKLREPTDIAVAESIKENNIVSSTTEEIKTETVENSSKECISFSSAAKCGTESKLVSTSITQEVPPVKVEKCDLDKVEKIQTNVDKYNDVALVMSADQKHQNFHTKRDDFKADVDLPCDSTKEEKSILKSEDFSSTPRDLSTSKIELNELSEEPLISKQKGCEDASPSNIKDSELSGVSCKVVENLKHEPLKETSTSKQEPQKEISTSKQEPQKKKSDSKCELQKETAISKQDPPKETSSSKQETTKETSSSKQEPQKEIPSPTQNPQEKMSSPKQEPQLKTSSLKQEQQKESSSLKQESQKEISSSKQETPSSKQETPSSKQETPSSKQETPSSKQETPSSKRETPSSKRETPSSKRETPSSKRETPSSKQEPQQKTSNSKQKTPSSKQEPLKASSSKQEKPFPKQESQKKASSAKQEMPKETPTLNEEPQKNTSSSKQETPSLNQEPQNNISSLKQEIQKNIFSSKQEPANKDTVQSNLVKNDGISKDSKVETLLSKSHDAESTLDGKVKGIPLKDITPENIECNASQPLSLSDGKQSKNMSDSPSEISVESSVPSNDVKETKSCKKRSEGESTKIVDTEAESSDLKLDKDVSKTDSFDKLDNSPKGEMDLEPQSKYTDDVEARSKDADSALDNAKSKDNGKDTEEHNSVNESQDSLLQGMSKEASSDNNASVASKRGMRSDSKDKVKSKDKECSTSTAIESVKVTSVSPTKVKAAPSVKKPKVSTRRKRRGADRELLEQMEEGQEKEKASVDSQPENKSVTNAFLFDFFDAAPQPPPVEVVPVANKVTNEERLQWYKYIFSVCSPSTCRETKYRSETMVSDCNNYSFRLKHYTRLDLEVSSLPSSSSSSPPEKTTPKTKRGSSRRETPKTEVQIVEEIPAAQEVATPTRRGSRASRGRKIPPKGSTATPPKKPVAASPTITNTAASPAKTRGRGSARARRSNRGGRSRRSAQKKDVDFTLPEGFLEILDNSKDKISVDEDDDDEPLVTLVKSRKGKKNISSVQSSESESLQSGPRKRSRRIQAQHQKKISELAVEMEKEQRRLEQLAKKNSSKTNSTPKTHLASKAKEKVVRAKPPAKPIFDVPDPEEDTIIEGKPGTRKRKCRVNMAKLALMYDDESKDSEHSTSRSTEKSRRRKAVHGKKRGHKPWDVSSGSSTTIEEISEEEEEEEEPEEQLIFVVNEDEFACEEVEENAEPVVVRRARTAKKVPEDENETECIVDDKPCSKCGKYDMSEWILLCDNCNDGYHINCLIPPLFHIPDGDWFCQPCEHLLLCQCLNDALHNLENLLKHKERDELRKQRLAYVGISLDNVLKPDKKESESEVEEKIEERKREKKYKDRDSSDEDVRKKVFGKRSSRTRRTVNYQFKEYDDLIASAIGDEILDYKVEDFAEPQEEEEKASEDDDSYTGPLPAKRKKIRKLNDLNCSDEDDSGDDYKGLSTDTEHTPSANTEISGSDAGSGGEWRVVRARTRTRTRRPRRKPRKRGGRYSTSEEEELSEGSNYRPVTRRATQMQVSYRELSSDDEEWGEAPKKKVTKRRKKDSSTSETSEACSYKSAPSPTQKKRSKKSKWDETSSESEEKSAENQSSESEAEDSEGTKQSAGEWKVEKSSEGGRIKLNINKKVLDSDSEESSKNVKTKKRLNRVISDSEEEEEEDDDDEEEDGNSSSESSEESEEEEDSSEEEEDEKNTKTITKKVEETKMKVEDVKKKSSAPATKIIGLPTSVKDASKAKSVTNSKPLPDKSKNTTKQTDSSESSSSSKPINNGVKVVQDKPQATTITPVKISQLPSNVAAVCRAVSALSTDQIPSNQIVVKTLVVKTVPKGAIKEIKMVPSKIPYKDKIDGNETETKKPAASEKKEPGVMKPQEPASSSGVTITPVLPPSPSKAPVLMKTPPVTKAPLSNVPSMILKAIAQKDIPMSVPLSQQPRPFMNSPGPHPGGMPVRQPVIPSKNSPMPQVYPPMMRPHHMGPMPHPHAYRGPHGPPQRFPHVNPEAQVRPPPPPHAMPVRSNMPQQMYHGGPPPPPTAAVPPPMEVRGNHPSKAMQLRASLLPPSAYSSPPLEPINAPLRPQQMPPVKAAPPPQPYSGSIVEPFSSADVDQGSDSREEVPLERIPEAENVSTPMYMSKSAPFEKDNEYRPAAKEPTNFRYSLPEQKGFQSTYSPLSSLQEFTSRPSPLKPSLVETYPSSESPSGLTPLESYPQANSPKGFISLETYSQSRKRNEVRPAEAYQGEPRFPQENFPSSPNVQNRDSGTPPRLYSQFSENYTPSRSPEFYQGQNYYPPEERANFQSGYNPPEQVTNYNYMPNAMQQQPNDGFMIDTILRARNEEDELGNVSGIVQYITQQ